MTPFALLEPSHPAIPVVVDSPHSGSLYPDDFRFTCPLNLLRQAEDFAVDQLIIGAAHQGAAVLSANFPRSYIDVNRAEDDLDPAVLAEPWPTPLAPGERTLLGLGLVRRLCRCNVPVYGSPLPVRDVQQRIEHYYRPYHQKLDELITRRMGIFGECYLINAHSMPGRAGEGRAGTRPDFVLGDRNGTSCDPAFTRLVHDLLQELGFSVALNDPYKGVEIVRRHGRPACGRHALQIEINRGLYMNEGALTLHEGFLRLQQSLREFFRLLAQEIIRSRADQLAAE